jgi:hypothetical protein
LQQRNQISSLSGVSFPDGLTYLELVQRVHVLPIRALPFFFGETECLDMYFRSIASSLRADSCMLKAFAA